MLGLKLRYIRRYYCLPVLRIRISFHADPDPDPDPGSLKCPDPDPGGISLCGSVRIRIRTLLYTPRRGDPHDHLVVRRQRTRRKLLNKNKRPKRNKSTVVKRDKSLLAA